MDEVADTLDDLELSIGEERNEAMLRLDGRDVVIVGGNEQGLLVDARRILAHIVRDRRPKRLE